mmetsp:Transcript_15520/g.10889  ORF Transcript_15520/g.10889 Transcript_15520/m.10889 type:complete len:95 (+) Transcript_15520:213-497(+)
MIHGFGGGGAIFFKMFPDLIKHFRVTTIDLMGMGCSGRPHYDTWGCTESIKYFLDTMKAWMEKTLYNKEPYYLLGHSFGGYIATQFAVSFPENI